MAESDTKYTIVTVESSDGGWIIRERNKPTKVIVRWEVVIRELEERLTNKGALL